MRESRNHPHHYVRLIVRLVGKNCTIYFGWYEAKFKPLFPIGGIIIPSMKIERLHNVFIAFFGIVNEIFWLSDIGKVVSLRARADLCKVSLNIHGRVTHTRLDGSKVVY